MKYLVVAYLALTLGSLLASGLGFDGLRLFCFGVGLITAARAPRPPTDYWDGESAQWAAEFGKGPVRVVARLTGVLLMVWAVAFWQRLQ